ncbi:hypothetical protein ACFCW2_12815 [Qipengyuania sp. DSG2-2]|uniref:hypothetical protein n=1 Tax=Qipengyuania sp. DGS2-2 TaxID=3349631 RepID=UPI0036D43AB4
MVRELDGIFIAIFVSKEPTAFGPAILMETVAPACDTKRPIEMHSTRSIDATGATAEERLEIVRDAVSWFYESSIEPCAQAQDLEARLFHRFDDAYLAMDALLVEANFLPLSSAEGTEGGEPDAAQENDPD